MYISLIQEALAGAGFDPGPIDGISGPQTISAIKAFQDSRGLEPDGLVGHLTHQALFSATTTPMPDSTAVYGSEWLTPHFCREEFRCCCEGRYCNGFPAEMEINLVVLLEQLRNYFNRPLHITSGVRCPIRNQEVGGIENSRHLVGAAADCYILGVSVYDLADAAGQIGLGVIIYEDEGFCHLEV